MIHTLIPGSVHKLTGTSSVAFPDEELHVVVFACDNEEFKRATYDRRVKGAFADTHDPARARWNHMQRDFLLAGHIQRCAEELRLAVVEIDGTQTLEEVISLVEITFHHSSRTHLGPPR
jgi:hypothetical protein